MGRRDGRLAALLNLGGKLARFTGILNVFEDLVDDFTAMLPWIHQVWPTEITILLRRWLYPIDLVAQGLDV